MSEPLPGLESAAEPDPPPQPMAAERRQRLIDLAIRFGLLLAVLLAYAQVVSFEFVDADDALFVVQNPHVRAGLSLGSLRWALTGVAANNWIPVTLVSHMLDVQLFGLHSGLHHLVNVVLHALAALLLFLAFERATGARGPSAFIAFVFALHPLHVESVAWVSERKDVLSACFWFLSLYAYVRYTERPDLERYLLVAGSFALGLMSKPMLVTFPFTLLLLDIWPLCRVQWPRMLWEKLPLFALSGGASLATFLVQQKTGAVGQAMPLDGRLAKALLSYGTYLRQMVWPVGLAVFYPYPKVIVAWYAGAAIVVISGVSASVLYYRRSRPYLAVGWFWFLGTLVPVIGLVQVGQQSHADRYMYIPMVGLLIMLAWGGLDLARRWPRIRLAVGAAAVLSCALCLVLSWQQTSYWRTPETLYQHAIDVTTDNAFAEGNLGSYLMNFPERRAESLEHLQTALRISPADPIVNNNLGAHMAKIGLFGAAIPYFQAALKADPNSVDANGNLGVCLMETGNFAAAVAYFENAARLRPDSPETHFNVGVSLSKAPGRELEAIPQYEAALKLRPDYEMAHRNLGSLLASQGRTAEAISHLEAAQQIRLDASTAELLDRLKGAQK